jgi:hypothetical protein
MNLSADAPLSVNTPSEGYNPSEADPRDEIPAMSWRARSCMRPKQLAEFKGHAGSGGQSAIIKICSIVSLFHGFSVPRFL